MEPTLVHANGVDLCYQAFGDRSDPAILLVMGAGASMDCWEDDFCAGLAAGARHVVRYDHRDTGQSTSYPPGAPGYTGADLVADPIALLDVLGLDTAHVVGMSMGGALAQVMALDHGDRVASLTLISTSPAGPGDDDLPPMTDAGRAAFGALQEPDWSDATAAIEYLTELSRALASPAHPFDEDAVRAIFTRSVHRTTNVESSMKNHHAAEGAGRWRERLGDLDVPTLVIHGSDDPIFPVGHGEALAREIPGAELLVLKGAGHEIPRRDWDVVVPAILRITQGS